MLESLFKLNFYQKQFNKLLNSEFIQYVKENTSIWVSLCVSVISFAFFFSISFPTEFYSTFGFVSIRLFGLYAAATILSITLLFGLLKYGFSWTFLVTFLQSNFLTFFSFSYIMSVEQPRFFYLIIGLLTALIFFVNWDIFGTKNHHFSLVLAQVLLISFQSFSWLNFLSVERVELLQFRQDLLKNVLTLSPVYWFILSSLAVGLISSSGWKAKSGKSGFGYALLLAFLVYQFFWIFDQFNFFGIFYWQKTLLFLIVWDFLYQPFKQISSKEQDENFESKLWISSFYHFSLILAILIFMRLMLG